MKYRGIVITFYPTSKVNLVDLIEEKRKKAPLLTHLLCVKEISPWLPQLSAKDLDNQPLLQRWLDAPEIGAVNDTGVPDMPEGTSIWLWRGNIYQQLWGYQARGEERPDNYTDLAQTSMRKEHKGIKCECWPMRLLGPAPRHEFKTSTNQWGGVEHDLYWPPMPDYTVLQPYLTNQVRCLITDIDDDITPLILADALTEIGFNNAEIIEALRSKEPSSLWVRYWVRSCVSSATIASLLTALPKKEVIVPEQAIDKEIDELDEELEFVDYTDDDDDDEEDDEEDDGEDEVIDEMAQVLN